MPSAAPLARLDPRKFADPLTTLRGQTRAHVALRALETLWFNTGTLCNLTCANCYIESSPRNDRLAYLSAADVAAAVVAAVAADADGFQACSMDATDRRGAGGLPTLFSASPSQAMPVFIAGGCSLG